ncbi:RDD family protein [uncultured Desulfuromusa sp.]|uniref:RDD family protein n=1 Tax=uncultured Desulfuromusa sp. TaxID=219183 RepID=UPI002AA7B289|nr:RDD family protein [uncultured Desulfuromusa sp.]
MRCPKCGYNSFDHLDSCKKCGKDLVEFKQSFGIKSVLFPGQMSASDVAEEPEFDSVIADAAVTAATGAATVAEDSQNIEPVADGTDGDDFGFDFMGDSAEDDDLSFDELFEEAPEDEDIEETIEAPKENAAASATETEDDFSFDLPDEDAELEDDFGFDPMDEASDPVEDKEFSFDDEPADSGAKEDPPRPFDSPESPQSVGAPESVVKTSEKRSSSIIPAAAEPDADIEEKTVTLESEASEEIFILEADENVPSAPSFEEKFDQENSQRDDEEIVGTSASPAFPPHALADEVFPEAAAAFSPDDAGHSSVIHPPLGPSIGAFIFDVIILIVVGISFVVAAEAAISTEKVRLIPSLETMIDLSVPYFLVLFFLAFGYFTLFHFLAGQTPGKMLVGLRVEATNGEPLVFSQAFLRSVGGLLQLIPVGLGYLLIFTSSERRGWNDRLAGTRVVALRDLPVKD